MKISLNWLRDYLEIDLPKEKISEVLTDIGLEVEGMEEVESIPGGLEGLVIGQVTRCEKHPNADRLTLTRVNVGGAEELQIVCGAPNVAAGQKVVVATVGTTLYPIEGESFQIKKGNIRGQSSEGMICAEDEIGLGHSHDGIMVLPEEVKIGMKAREYFQIESDTVYEIGLTPNRSDATSHIGVARDLAATLKINYEHSGKVTLPDTSGFRIDNTDLPVEVILENEEACPRYSGLTISGIRIGESPDWLKNRLKAIDVRPINNVVDITNYILHEYGQPLHAFDLEAIADRTIRVKTLPEGSPFVTLDEQERKLSAEDLMICNGRSKGMCIGGVFGGVGSGVTEQTTAIFLESAHFNPRWIRRSSTRHLLRTDAAKVFEKGSDPSITVNALKRAALLIQELAGGKVSSEIVDLYPKPIRPKEVEVSYEYVQRLIGVQIPPEEIRQVLEAMGMKIVKEDKEVFQVAVTTDKYDVTRPADVVEEILRIYGLNKIPFPDKLRISLSYTNYPSPALARESIAHLLSANGFMEMMAMSMSESRYYRDILPVVGESELVYINNTSNIHLDIMRPSMLFGGLEAVLRNQNRQQSDLMLYEFGKTYRHSEEGIREESHLALFLSGRRWQESWLPTGNKTADYYSLRSFVDNILARLGLEGYQQTAFSDEVFAFALRYHRGPRELVSFGRLHEEVQQKMDLRNPVFYADFHWDVLTQSLAKQKIGYEELNKYPSVRRDLALVVDNSVKFSDIVAIARKRAKKLLADINLFDVYTNEEQLGAGKKSYAVSFIFENPERTLKDGEIDKVMDQLIREYETKTGATIRR